MHPEPCHRDGLGGEEEAVVSAVKRAQRVREDHLLYPHGDGAGDYKDDPRPLQFQKPLFEGEVAEERGDEWTCGRDSRHDRHRHHDKTGRVDDGTKAEADEGRPRKVYGCCGPDAPQRDRQRGAVFYGDDARDDGDYEKGEGAIEGDFDGAEF